MFKQFGSVIFNLHDYYYYLFIYLFIVAFLIRFNNSKNNLEDQT